MNNENKTWDKVLLARDSNRITSKTLIKAVFKDFLELHGDRHMGDDQALIGGLASFEGINVTVIAHEKGTTTEERIKHNFGMAHPEGYHKALRLMKQAEKFNRPIITIIDTPGAYPGLKAEEHGQAYAIANIIQAMMQIKVPIIATILSEGGSGGALALGVADVVAMFENSIYSVVSPEGFATISFKDSKKAPEVSKLMKLEANDLLGFGVIDEIIKEEKPLNIDMNYGINEYRKFIKKQLQNFEKFDEKQLLINRYNRFRRIGFYQENIGET